MPQKLAHLSLICTHNVISNVKSYAFYSVMSTLSLANVLVAKLFSEKGDDS